MIFTQGCDSLLVKAYTGMPSGNILASTVEQGEATEGYAGYDLITWALVVDWDWMLDGEPQQWSYWSLTVGDVTQTHQVWLAQAFKRGSPLCAEYRWHPDLGISESINGFGVEPHPTRVQIDDALRAFGLIHGAREKRRPGPAPNDREIERREILQAVANTLRRRLKVSRISVARQLCLSEDGFDDKRERCQLELKSLQALTLEQLAGQGIFPN